MSKESKTNENLITGINCTANTALEEMLAVKTAWGKLDGRQHIQFIQSFAPNDPLTPETAHEIGVKLANSVLPKGFQALVATHIDRDHIHNHIIVNSVNMETGLKWKQGRSFLLHVRDTSDELCREYGLSILPEPKERLEKAAQRGEYEATQQQRSWKYELRLAARECLYNAVDKDDFMKKLNHLGYSAIWTDERKHVTFISPDGMKCRGRMLGPKYSKEAMLEQFQQNWLQQDQQKMDARITLLGSLIHQIRSLDDGGMGSSHMVKYPLSALEGQALKEKLEQQKDKGLDWEHQ